MLPTIIFICGRVGFSAVPAVFAAAAVVVVLFVVRTLYTPDGAQITNSKE